MVQFHRPQFWIPGLNGHSTSPAKSPSVNPCDQVYANFRCSEWMHNFSCQSHVNLSIQTSIYSMVTYCHRIQTKEYLSRRRRQEWKLTLRSGIWVKCATPAFVGVPNWLKALCPYYLWNFQTQKVEIMHTVRQGQPHFLGMKIFFARGRARGTAPLVNIWDTVYISETIRARKSNILQALG